MRYVSSPHVYVERDGNANGMGLPRRPGSVVAHVGRCHVFFPPGFWVGASGGGIGIVGY